MRRDRACGRVGWIVPPVLRVHTRKSFSISFRIRIIFSLTAAIFTNHNRFAFCFIHQRACLFLISCSIDEHIVSLSMFRFNLLDSSDSSSPPRKTSSLIFLPDRSLFTVIPLAELQPCAHGRICLNGLARRRFVAIHAGTPSTCSVLLIYCLHGPVKLKSNVSLPSFTRSTSLRAHSRRILLGASPPLSRRPLPNLIILLTNHFRTFFLRLGPFYDSRTPPIFVVLKASGLRSPSVTSGNCF